MVLNILMSNVDDHLRNHDFLWTGKNGWALSPAYDLNPTPHSALLTELVGYARPNDKISELVRIGTLTRLKKGLYTLSDNPQLSKEMVANHLQGLSYISCHWALSYYGLLPEAVSRVPNVASHCSVCIKLVDPAHFIATRLKCIKGGVTEMG